MRFDNIPLQTISVNRKLCKWDISVLRLDCLHKQISGNKWFKLQYYLDAFGVSGKKALATFGGAYSNHIAATAAACKLLSIPCIGVIRGERPAVYSHTLRLAELEGMELCFVDRDTYKDKEKIMAAFPSYYWVPEGGYGILGMKGAADIWNYIPSKGDYSSIFLPVGSGTTIAGILNGAGTTQDILGVSVMKNNFSLEQEISTLIEPGQKERLTLLHDYHFGGYAKKTAELLDFMNQIWSAYKIPLDFVYTAKAFYAMLDQIDNGLVPFNSKILFVHTGGLQGNLSLTAGTLIY
ncbi:MULTISPECIES: 1-aminocyclopropane-1-carboxylate deaminase/D-cysteine desulfhydrase [Chitinophagaceae]